MPGRTGVGSGGPRPGGGRPKGVVNSESIKLQELALASGFAPLDVLLVMMRWHYDKAQRLLKPTKSAFEAVEKVVALADRGFIIVDKDAKPEDGTLQLQHNERDPTV